jgi:parvulin-like peptidyl-prolyl isomerase
VKSHRSPRAARRLAPLVVALACAASGACTRHGRAPTQPAAAEAEAEAGAVARVDGAFVSRAEWRRVLTAPLERARLVEELGGGSPDEAELEQLALRKVIRQHLLVKEAERRGLFVTEEELDGAVRALRRGFGDLRTFGAWMQGRGLDEVSLFEDVRAGTLVARARAALAGEVRLGRGEVERYHRANAQELRVEEVRLQLIVVASRAAGTDVMKLLQDGAPFAEVARARSLGARAARGGDTGWVEAQALPPPLREVVARMEPRQAVGPVERGEEYLVVRLAERRRGRAKTLDEAGPEIERRLLAARQQEVVERWLEEREKRSKVEVLLSRADDSAAAGEGTAVPR